MPRLKGKNALITGASTGIGQAIAVRFAQEGANVAINYRSAPEEAATTEVQVQEACKGVPNGCRELIVQADISKEDQVKTMFERVSEAFGSIDILVNNAGIQKPAPSHEIAMDDFDRVVGVCIPMFSRGHPALPGTRQRRSDSQQLERA